jgi:antirestriction protein ArdC
MQGLDAADGFFAATGVEIGHGGTRVYYAERPDYVQKTAAIFQRRSTPKA